MSVARSSRSNRSRFDAVDMGEALIAPMVTGLFVTKVLDS
jgi:hypothetical protein